MVRDVALACFVAAIIVITACLLLVVISSTVKNVMKDEEKGKK